MVTSSLITAEVKMSHVNSGHMLLCKRQFDLKDVKYVDEYLEYDGAVNSKFCRVTPYHGDSFVVRIDFNKLTELHTKVKSSQWQALG